MAITWTTLSLLAIFPSMSMLPDKYSGVFSVLRNLSQYDEVTGIVAIILE